jgi:hypothetical protein
MVLDLDLICFAAASFRATKRAEGRWWWWWRRREKRRRREEKESK